MIIDNNYIKQHNFLIELDEDGNYIFNFSQEIENDIDIIIKKNKRINISLHNFSILKCNFFIQENSLLNFKIISNSNSKSLDLKGNLCKSSLFNIYLADIQENNLIINSNIILYGEDSSSEFRYSVLAKNNNIKRFNISYSHLAKNTNSKLIGFGVSQNEAFIHNLGITHIMNDSIKSYATQEIKMILFDKTSKASASPTLKIDCDDIKANHGCAIGSLNEEHLFYLLSRGLSLLEARKIITLGYLLPISKYFNEEEKEQIEKEIREIL